LILLAFLLPLAVYLLALGLVNRRPHPLLVNGVWDFIGLLFAVSGFLFFGGPAALSGLEERWRMYWLLGPSPGAPPDPGGSWPAWGIAAAVYFVLVVAGAGWLLARRRHLTAVYNVTPEIVEQALDEACTDLGLDPVRSGNLFLFGMAAGKSQSHRIVAKDFQAPNDLPPAVSSKEVAPATLNGPDPGSGLADQAAILELDAFAAMNHVTLRWDPSDLPLRHEVEYALARRLRELPGPDSDLGSWLVLVASTFLGFVAVAGLGLLALRIWSAG
jgi:hypothetical protein